MLTNQQIFDKVATHLLTQGDLSINMDGICQYRADSGFKCAAGVLIHDEHYSPDLEGSSVALPGGVTDDDELRWRRNKIQAALIASGVNVDEFSTLELVMNLQAIHDNTPPHNWRASLKSAAVRAGLSPQVVEEFGQ